MTIQDDIDALDPTKPINPPVTVSAPKPTTASVRFNFAAIKLALQGLLDGLNDKQDTLVSTANIKTINGVSILGSGNITVSGGGGVESGASKVYKYLNF